MRGIDAGAIAPVKLKRFLIRIMIFQRISVPQDRNSLNLKNMYFYKSLRMLKFNAYVQKYMKTCI